MWMKNLGVLKNRSLYLTSDITAAIKEVQGVKRLSYLVTEFTDWIVLLKVVCIYYSKLTLRGLKVPEQESKEHLHLDYFCFHIFSQRCSGSAWHAEGFYTRMIKNKEHELGSLSSGFSRLSSIHLPGRPQQ